MNHFYENKTEITLEKYLYMCNHPIGKTAVKKLRRWKSVQILCMIIMAVNIVWSLWITSYLLAGLSAVLFMCFIYKYFFQRNRLNKKQYETVRQSQNSDKWIRTILFASDVQVVDGNTVTYLRYSDFVKLSENEKYYLLYKNDDFVLRVEKGCFTIGEELQFMDFLKEKVRVKA